MGWFEGDVRRMKGQAASEFAGMFGTWGGRDVFVHERDGQSGAGSVAQRRL